jgi:hypothetical protein
MTTYQRLKKENEQLRWEIKTLIEDKNYGQVVCIRIKYAVLMAQEKALWFGEHTVEDTEKKNPVHS